MKSKAVSGNVNRKDSLLKYKIEIQKEHDNGGRLKNGQVFSKSTKESILETPLIFLLLAAVKIVFHHGGMKVTKRGLARSP